LVIPGVDTSPQVTIAPISGPPGTTLHVLAAGFPVDTHVQVGAGVVNTEFSIIEEAQTDASGTLDRDLILPEFAQPGEEWVVVVRAIGTEIKGTSNPFRVTLDDSGADQSGAVSRVTLYLVALGDDGRIGRPIGCNDSLVPVEVEVGPTRTPLRSVLEQLLLIENATQGDTKLYNALDRSDLTIDDVTLDGSKAVIALSGDLRLGGVCDAPRVEEQIRATALHFSTVTKVDVSINGMPLEEVLSARQ
jgi:hypothetical protein